MKNIKTYTKTYKEAGVDITKEKETIKDLVNELKFKRNNFGKPINNIGHYAGLIECGNFIMAITTDGVGSKVLIALEMNKFDTIGIDCIAMNVNDLISIGAEPLSFVDYLAVEKHDPFIAKEIGKGMNRGAEKACISIVGGETATLPDIVKGLDLSGTCIGYIKNKNDIIDGKNVNIGDIVIGIESSGIHSNGFSLIRRLLKEKNYSYNDYLPYNKHKTIGEELLTPTKIYMDVLDSIKKCNINGLAHITGGGITKLHRVTKYGFNIYAPLKIPKILKWIQKIGNINICEMYKTFNMGIGFVVIVSKNDKNNIEKIIKLTNGKIIGEVIEEKQIKINHIIIK